MELSMWTLYDLLGELSPRARITRGEAGLTGARLARPGEEERPGLAWVCPGAEGALVRQGEDWLELGTADAALALNRVLDVFARCGAWERALAEAARRGAPLERFLELSRAMLPYPMYIQDNGGRLVAHSREYGPGEVDPYWDAVLEGQFHQRLFAGGLMDAEGRPVRDWSAVPAVYPTDQHRVVGANLELDGEIVGAIAAIEHGPAFTPGVCQRMAVLAEAITQALRRSGAQAELRSAAALVGELLDGGAADLARLEEILRRATGSPGPWTLVAARSTQRSDFAYLSASAWRMGRGEVPCLALAHRDCVLAAVSTAREESFLARLGELLFENTYRIGVSLPFARAEELPSARGQAELALRHGAGAPGLYRCVSYAYHWLLRRLSEVDGGVGRLLHPALDALERYDALHGTALSATLRVYLECERNAVHAARRLHIHRNSMLYRLQRIERLAGADLEDPEERMYLLLSFQLREHLRQNGAEA